MDHLPCTLYTGELFDNNVAVVVPRDARHLPALWWLCSSPDFRQLIRGVNQKLSVDPRYLTAIPFDLARWQKVAEEMGPLPEPYSNDPTQWLFKGDPSESTEPLQVA